MKDRDVCYADAIPIEWIKSWMKRRNSVHDERSVTKMLEDWEREKNVFIGSN